MKVVLVTGSRSYPDQAHVYQTLDEEMPDLVIHGGAKTFKTHQFGYQGADYFAGAWCDLHDVPQVKAPYKRALGKRGGPVRNTWMIGVLLMFLTQGHDCTVVAFPGNTGTADTMEKARRAGITVRRMEAR